MESRLAEVLAASGGVVSRGDALAAGVSRDAWQWALARRAVERVAPGVAVDAVMWAELDAVARHRCRTVAALSRSNGAVAAGLTAAVLWDLPLAGPPPAAPILLRPRSTGRPEYGRGSGPVHRRAWLGREDVTEIAGVPVTSLARTVFDVARTVPVPWGLAAADRALARGAAAAEIMAAGRRCSPCPGSARARLVAGWADPRAESPLESVARAVVRLLGLPPPDLQVRLGREGLEYRADLLVPEFMTVIEVDGKVKYVGDSARPDQAWQDKRRRDHLLTWGYEVERFVAADEHRPQRWGRHLLQAFARAARRHGLEPPDVDPGFPGYRTT